MTGLHGLAAGRLALAAALVAASTACAQTTAPGAAAPAASPPAAAAPPPAPLPYGTPIGLAEAKRMLAAAEDEARRNNWTMAIAVVDSGGQLVGFSRLDGTQHASIDIAIGKATTAVRFKRPTKALEDAVGQGGNNLRLLALPDITPLEGGVPIVVGGRIVGAMGASGGTSTQDVQVVRAGLDTLR